MAFVTAQRRPRPGAENVVRIADGSVGTVGGDDQAPSGCGLEPLWLSDHPRRRRCGDQPGAPGHRHPAEPSPRRDVVLPLVRGVRRLPRILDPDEIEALMGALRTERDRAMTQAMVLGGLRRCEVLGLRLGDLRLGEWRVLHRRGQGRPRTPGAALADLLRHRGPLHGPRATTDATSDRALRLAQGPAAGPAALGRRDSTRSSVPPGSGPGSVHGTCHELRHTCFTRLREAGMAIEAIQAQAGHRSITSTRIYLHLSVDWLADEYRRAIEAIEAQALVGVAR